MRKKHFAGFHTNEMMREWHGGTASNVVALPVFPVLAQFTACVHILSGFSSFLPPFKNMPVSGLAFLNCPRYECTCS